jgi:hypothetical protein
VRNPDRIPHVLETIEDNWTDSPDTPLGELLEEVTPDAPHAIEDDELVECLDGDLPVEYYIDQPNGNADTDTNIAFGVPADQLTPEQAIEAFVR